LFISISDVSEYIKQNSLIDQYALKRPSSIYLSTHTYHMIPEIISTGILSLNHNQERLTQTLEINFDNDFNIISTNNYESIFYNKNRLDYENFEKHFSNPESPLYKNLQILYKLSQVLKEKRTKK
jgi:ribonuclease R